MIKTEIDKSVYNDKLQVEQDKNKFKRLSTQAKVEDLKDLASDVTGSDTTADKPDPKRSTKR